MTRRALVLALAVSMALNLFGLGWLSAKGFGRGSKHRAERGDGSHMPRRARTRWLSSEDRKLLRPRREAMRQARREAKRQLESEPFDRAGLASALAALRKQADAMQEVVHEQMTARAASMTSEQRKELSERHFRRKGRRRREKR